MNINHQEAIVLEKYCKGNYDENIFGPLQPKDINRINENRYVIEFENSNLVILTPSINIT